MTQEQHYTFGDTDRAAARLRALARVFGPSSHRLLASLRRSAGDLAIDLGCGPGYTTALLAEHVTESRVLGLDQSPKLLEQARRERSSERVSFAQGDVSAPPFPAPPASLLYARFLLTHLRDPAKVVQSWATCAEPGARLVLEETAFMHGEHGAFPRYYALVERMQAHYGQRMYIGKDLAALSESAVWRVEQAEISVASLPAIDMAGLHSSNLQTWSNDPFAQTNYDRASLAELGAELAQIAAGEVPAAPISCGMAQVVLRRR
jgi:ubiquinone/menaquinone biosynthesis C-methylase UbiE